MPYSWNVLKTGSYTFESVRELVSERFSESASNSKAYLMKQHQS